MPESNIVDIYPLSPMQQGMLFHTLLAPEGGDYFEQITVLLRGPLNRAAWQQAWETLVKSHPVLRTGFIWEDIQTPMQVVFSDAPVKIEDLDWQEYGAQEQQRKLEEYLRADRKRGFELSRAPLMRVAFLKRAGDLHWMVWSHHHILLDGWSIQLLSGQLFELYEARCHGRTHQLEKSRPYADYIGWMQQQNQAAVETYWRGALKGFSTPAPIGNPLVVGGVSQHLNVFVSMDATQSDRLKQFARSKHLTMNTLVQTAWALLLSFYSGEADVVFGTTVSGRPSGLAGVETMIGLFINTLPVRSLIRPQEATLALLKRMQLDQAEARQYESASLESIQMWSEVPRGQPLFETLVIFENYPAAELDIGSQTELSAVEVRGYEHSHYPLVLSAWSGENVGLRFSYDSLRFEEATVRHLARHYQNLLNALVVEDTVRVSSLSMLGTEEREELLARTNKTEAEIPLTFAHVLFEVQAARTPHAISSSCEGSGLLSYESLNQRANQLAHYLQKQGVGPEVRVALYLERSLDLIVALLATLKAGGAYVPLDPDFPVERLTWMLHDSGAAVLVTQQHLASRLDPGEANVIAVDLHRDRIQQEPCYNLDTYLSPHHLAYVLYTSGSTGQPKGVQITHGALANLLGAVQRKLALTEEDVLVAVTTLSFDIATLELMLPLSVGAHVRLAIREEILDGDVLESVLVASAATLMQATPATWRMLLETAWRPRGLKVLCGGEEMSVELAGLLAERGDDIWNLYGPTETTIWATMHCISSAEGKRVPIGNPLANTRAYVLGSFGGLLPSGTAGELFLGGAQLARGYLGQAALTAERFVPDPYGPNPGGRLYRTGDLVRSRPDGALEFLSRTDRQVKIRGFRIELAEIEATLSLYPGVRQSVVVARRDVRDGQQLIAYVAGSSDSVNVATAGLRAFLKQRLPEYMVPSLYMFLERIPIGSNGKIDHKQLPDPDLELRAQTAYAPPQNEVEKMLCRIWEEVLELTRIGVDDDFFALGGHSLLAMKIASRIRRAFNIPMPLIEVFRAPTIRELRARVDEYTATSEQTNAISVGDEAASPDPQDDFLNEVLTGLESLSDKEAQALLGLSPE